MKIKAIKYYSLVILSVITLSFSSCKKWQHQYPEDGEKTKDTPMKRLCNKWWVLQSAKLNGYDYIDSINSIFGDYQIYFSDALDQSSSKTIYLGSINTDKEMPFSSVWQFVEDETIIGISPLNGNYSDKRSIIPGYLNHSSFNKDAFTILKLTNSEFKISTKSINGDTTIINQFILQ